MANADINHPTAWAMLTSLGKVAVLSVYGDKFYLHEPGLPVHEVVSFCQTNSSEHM